MGRGPLGTPLRAPRSGCTETEWPPDPMPGVRTRRSGASETTVSGAQNLSGPFRRRRSPPQNRQASSGGLPSRDRSSRAANSSSIPENVRRGCGLPGSPIVPIRRPSVETVRSMRISTPRWCNKSPSWSLGKLPSRPGMPMGICRTFVPLPRVAPPIRRRPCPHVMTHPNPPPNDC